MFIRSEPKVLKSHQKDDWLKSAKERSFCQPPSNNLMNSIKDTSLFEKENEQLKVLNEKLVSRCERLDKELRIQANIKLFDDPASMLLFASQIDEKESAQTQLTNQLEEYRQKLDKERTSHINDIRNMNERHLLQVHSLKLDFTTEVECLHDIVSTAANHGLLDKIKKIQFDHKKEIGKLKDKIQRVHDEKGKHSW